MLYPTIKSTTSCIVCSTSTQRACQNCLVSHCNTDLMWGSCAGCLEQRLKLEQGARYTAAIAYGAVTAVALPILLMAGASFLAALTFPIMLVMLLGFFAVPKWIARLLGPVFAQRRFAPTSKPRKRGPIITTAENGWKPVRKPFRKGTRRLASRHPVLAVVGRGIVFQ